MKGLFKCDEFEFRKRLGFSLTTKLSLYTIEDIVYRYYRFKYVSSVDEFKELLNIPNNTKWSFKERVDYVLENF